jgi:hypothetical protein
MMRKLVHTHRWCDLLALLCIVCAGLFVRVIITYFIMGTRRYTWKEKLFYAVAWTPKATVQASLSAVPLALINQTMQDNPDYEQWQQWGQDILATGIFAIVVCATLGTACVFWLAPVLLEKEVGGWPTHCTRSHIAVLTTSSFLGAPAGCPCWCTDLPVGFRLPCMSCMVLQDKTVRSRSAHPAQGRSPSHALA